MSAPKAARTEPSNAVDAVMESCFDRAGGEASPSPRDMSTATEARSNPLAQIDWDHVEFYVGNAKQAAHYYMSALASIRSLMRGRRPASATA